jgi:hypothetical protein
MRLIHTKTAFSDIHINEEFELTCEAYSGARNRQNQRIFGNNGNDRLR